MGLRYAAFIDQVAVTAVQDVFEITAPSSKAVCIHSIVIGQGGGNDAGDAQAEMLPLRLIRGNTTTGSGGATVTPTPLETGFPAAGSTVKRNNTTVASAGSPVTVHADAFNVQAGWPYQPTPEEKIWLSPSQRLVVNLPVAPADSLTVSATLIFEEFGG